MSGGHFDYEYCTIENTYCGNMEDRELNDMMVDLVKLLKDLEWYMSGDTSSVEYRESVVEFKRKWFKGDRAERYKEYFKQEYERLVEEFSEV